MSSTTSTPTTSNAPPLDSTINIYPFCLAGGVLFLCIIQLIFSKWICIKCLQPKRVTAETTRCCWDDGAFRKIEYHPGELQKIKEISGFRQFLHHLLLTSPFMPTDDTFRAMSRHHRGACFWAVFATPLLTVTLLMKNPSPLELVIDSSSSSSTTNINEDIFNFGNYNMLSLILNLVCGVGSTFIGRFFWSLFASAPRPIRLVPREAAEKELAERSAIEKTRDRRFAVTWCLWIFWMLACVCICIVFGLKLPTSSSAPVMQHVLLSGITLVIGFFIADPIFCVILICLFPKCECAKDVSKRLVHPGLFSLAMGNSAIESHLLSVEYEGAMKLENTNNNNKKRKRNNSGAITQNANNKNNDEKESTSIVPPPDDANNNKKVKSNNNKNKKSDDKADDDSDLEDKTLRDKNPSELDDNDIECDDEISLQTATREERLEYVKAKLETLDTWAELPPETSKMMSPLKVVKRSEITAASEEERKKLQQEEEEASRKKRLEEIKNSGGLKAPKLQSDGSWSRPAFVGPAGSSSSDNNKFDDNDQDNNNNTTTKNPLMCVVTKAPMSQQQLRQLQQTKVIDTKVQSALSLANQVLQDADHYQRMTEIRQERERQAELDKILGNNNNNENEAPSSGKNYQPSALGKSLASLFSNVSSSNNNTSTVRGGKFGSRGLSKEEQALWDQQQQQGREMDSFSNNNNNNDDDDCDDEVGGGGISLNQQVRILNSIGMDSIATAPHYSKNKKSEENATTDKKNAIRPAKNKEIDEFFFSDQPDYLQSKNQQLFGTTPDGSRLQQQGAVSKKNNFADDNLLFDGDNGTATAKLQGIPAKNNTNNNNTIHALSPLSIRRMNSTSSPGSNNNNKTKTIDELGGLLDLPPPASSSNDLNNNNNNSSALSSVLQSLKKSNSSPTIKKKKQKLDPLDTTSEDDDDEEKDGMAEFFSLPRSSQRNNNSNNNHMINTPTTAISIPASPSSASSSNASPPRQNAPKFGRGGNNNNNNNNSNMFFTEQEEPPVFEQKQLGRNAFLPKVETDGEWRMVANPWEMI